MSLQRVPRVWFLLQTRSPRRSGRDFFWALKERFSASFGIVRSYRLPFSPVSHLVLAADGNAFLVGLMYDKHAMQGAGAWLLSINPFDYPVPKREMPKHAEGKYSKGLKQISEQIDALLASTLDVTQQAWFFDGWERTKPGVQTSVELPWNSDP